MDANITNTTTTDQLPPLPLDAGSFFVLAVTLCVFCGPLFVLFPPFPPRRSDALWQTHTKLGLSDPSKSNLPDRATTSSTTTTDNTTQAKIKSLFVYPVKSCRGIEVTRAKVIPTGLEFDRLFSFAQLKSPFPVSASSAAAAGDSEGESEDGVLVAAGKHRWDFITQRQFPLLATVQVEVWQPDLDKLKGLDDKNAQANSETFLILRFPWHETGLFGLWELFAAKCLRGWRAVVEKEILLPVHFPPPDEIAAKGYRPDETISVWGDDVAALDMSVELPKELALYLGVSNKLGLFRANPDTPREVHQSAPKKEEAGYQPIIGFQDSYPVHIMNLASVRDLESKIAKDEQLQNLSPRRFRANIFVSDLSSYDEDNWKKVQFNPDASSQQQEKVTFHVSCRTTRCKMPNVDQDTGVRHAVEPDKTLRAQRAIDKGAPRKGCLGMQMTPLFKNPDSLQNFLEIGMSIDVLERGEHVYEK